jgi:hypothetical protein
VSAHAGDDGGAALPDLPVLVDERLWPEFVDPVREVGKSWTARSGRTYRLVLDGRRLEVLLVLDGFGPPPPADDVDVDLLDLVCEIHDRKGGAWSGAAVRETAALWGWSPPA